MSEETQVDTDDLNAFEEAFFEKPAKELPAEVVADDEEIVVENQEETPATDEPEDEPETEEPEDEPEEEDEEEEEPAPKPKKKSAQERINELTKAKREAERREADLLRRLEALEKPAQKEEVKPEAPKSAEGPSPDAVDEDGEPVYPLGEFDPKYIRDLTKFTIAEERAAAREADRQEAEEAEMSVAKTQLEAAWLEKLSAAEEELPDLREKLLELEETFEDMPADYGEYLAATIMSCDYGPQIMYYLSQNIGEAQKIVASGPAAATLAIGRLEARFTPGKQEPKRDAKKVSNAPKPPEQRTRGSGGKFDTSPDTDDLDAFERAFFKK